MGDGIAFNTNKSFSHALLTISIDAGCAVAGGQGAREALACRDAALLVRTLSTHRRPD
jgi:hypothetical protein